MILLGIVSADNSVPIMHQIPGYQLGTKSSNIEVRLFYDWLCPDSANDHYIWQELLPQPSPVDGLTYEEYLNVRVSPFVLPYHLHSFQVTQVTPYLQDMCSQDEKYCSFVD